MHPCESAKDVHLWSSVWGESPFHRVPPEGPSEDLVDFESSDHVVGAEGLQEGELAGGVCALPESFEFILVHRYDILRRAVEECWGHVLREEGPLTGEEDGGRAREL